MDGPRAPRPYPVRILILVWPKINATTASRVGIAWGICKFEKFWSWETRCSPIQPFKRHVKPQKMVDWKCRTEAKPWHCPPSKFESGRDMFEGVDTFTVVRDPYERMVSEYYYFFAKKGDLIKERNITVGNLNDPKFMNDWIEDAARRAIREGECYRGHCVPLHEFVYSRGKKVITHVLKLEELEGEFPKLMERYNLPVKLEHANSRKDASALGAKDLSKAAIERINEWARLDLEYFGYKMLDPTRAEK